MVLHEQDTMGYQMTLPGRTMRKQISHDEPFPVTVVESFDVCGSTSGVFHDEKSPLTRLRYSLMSFPVIDVHQPWRC